MIFLPSPTQTMNQKLAWFAANVLGFNIGKSKAFTVVDFDS